MAALNASFPASSIQGSGREPKGGSMVIVKRGRLLVLAAATCWIGWGSAVHADWASCQKKPTRDCVLEEAFRGNSGPLTGRDRLDVMVRGGALLHPEYLTAADIAEAQRLAQSIRDTTGWNYAFLAVHGLVATNQKQQAIDLIASLGSAAQTLAINYVVRDLVKADDLETALALPDRMQPRPDSLHMPTVRNTVVIAAVKALAEFGKIDAALLLMVGQKHVTEGEIGDMLTAVGQAFLKRGDAKLAERAFDQAERNLEAARHYTSQRSGEMQFRFASIRLLALRGQTDAVNAALQELRSATAAADASTDYERSQGYQRVVLAFLEINQPEAALSIAKAITPDARKDAIIAGIAGWEARNGRLADARAVLSSLSSAQETARASITMNLAIGSAQEGDVASALRFAGELHDPSSRRSALFAVAQLLPR
jgi:hypothetical protein